MFSLSSAWVVNAAGASECEAVSSLHGSRRRSAPQRHDPGWAWVGPKSTETGSVSNGMGSPRGFRCCSSWKADQRQQQQQ